MKHSFKFLTFLLITLLIATSCISDNTVNLDDDIPPESIVVYKSVKVEAGYRDQLIIPDKFNTGYDPNQKMISVVGDTEYNGIKIRSSSNDTKYALGFFYNNSKVEGTVVLENLDFSNKTLIFINEEKVDREITVIFKNCVFSKISTGKVDSKVNYIFDNCTLGSFFGSNATFNYSNFGGTIFDALNPYRNVIVNNCYISDLAHPLEDRILHTDGTQIYGYNGLDSTNIHYTNTRFEVPAIPYAVNKGLYVNSCIAVALENSNGYNMSFNDIIMNGGGFSIYAHAKNTEYSLTDISFNNVSIGSSKKWGNVYYRISDDVVMNNIEDTSALYVASVWKESNKIHLSVSNDTNTSRTLYVITENGTEEFLIPSNPQYDTIIADTMSFNDFPFDIDITIDDSNWVVCYDNELSPENQIRFVNWGYEEVFVDLPDGTIEEDLVLVSPESDKTSEVLSTNSDSSSEQPLSGSCGNDITYQLVNGTLILSGNGATFNYTSGSPAPWYEYIDNIESVIINEGITEIGSQLFRNGRNISTVTLPTTLEKIGQGSFMNWSSLKTITFPVSLKNIVKYAFAGSGLELISYYGNESEWSKIIIEDYNTPIHSSILDFVKEVGLNANPGIVDQGSCGIAVTWILYDNGTLILSGQGSTSKFTSGSPAPWADYRSEITSVKISENITTLGEQLFAKCNSFQSIVIPNTVVSINKNAFIGCKSLEVVTFGSSVKVIESQAFFGTSLTNVNYYGTETDWSSIEIGDNNSRLIESTINFY